MIELHQHPPDPNDTRNLMFLSPEGRIIDVPKMEWPLAWCILPDCPLNPNPRNSENPNGEGSSTADRPANAPLMLPRFECPDINPEYLKKLENSESSIDSKEKPKTKMLYNLYGELVEADHVTQTINSEEMSLSQMFRLINLNWHHQYKRKMAEVLAAQIADKPSTLVVVDDLVVSGLLMSWVFKAVSKTPVDNTPGGGQKAPVYDGPPRVLDIGCDTGKWCLTMKKQHPDWIFEGVDDVDHWVKENVGVDFKDFMDGKVRSDKPADDYFSRIHPTQERPEFTARNLNTLMKHDNPIPHNLYSIIHGRDIFLKIENYKVFLEEVRLMLQPDGVVEFIEYDPRPRFGDSVTIAAASGSKDHKSSAVTGFSRNIADRFKSPAELELASDVPGWIARVDERLKGGLRPIDGVAAANLKSWVEGAGFWDVKETIVRLPVGGDTRSGQLLSAFIKWQVLNEDTVPSIAEMASKPEHSALDSGAYFLNLHIVTGRKPLLPRPGDLLLDGSRYEMTPSTYDAMARFGSTKVDQPRQWERHLKAGDEVNLAAMMNKLTTGNN